MLSRLLVIREFVERDLHGLAGPDCITVERRQNADGTESAHDPAYSVVTLKIGERKYGLSVKASQLVPPLGEILFTDRQTGELIRGEVRDLIWREIAEHIKAAHRGDTQATVAPAPVALEPPAPVVLPVAAPLDGRLPRIGLPIMFTPHPSQARGGVAEMAGIINKVYPDGSIAATLFPFHGEPMWVDRVPRRRTSLDVSVWDFAAEDVSELRQMLEDLTAPPPADDGTDLEQLRASAESAGVKVDRRWGADRLRQEIEQRRKGEAA